MWTAYNAPLVFLALWGACLTYLRPLDKQPHWKSRCCGLMLLSVAGGSLFGLLVNEKSWLLLVGGFVFAVFFFLLCGDMPLNSALYCGVWAHISQQLVMEICTMLRLSIVSLPPALWFFLSFLFCLVCYGVVGVTLARWMPVEGHYAVGPRQLVVSLLILVIFEGLCQLLIMEQSLFRQFTPFTFVLAQLYCATMLYFQYTLFSKSAIKQELAILNRLWFEQKEQYELAKETISIINRKCHDLKHQISALRTSMNQDNQREYLLEIEESVRIYDSILKTGNEVLDTILTEKSLFCEANGIQITCVADGKQLRFMNSVDVYAMMGNALDNAIEAVQRLEDPEKRMIDILICAERQFLILRISNPVEGELTFRDDLPVSTKADNGYHGFGLKSIRYTAKKYGGYATASVENGQFILTVLFPLSEI